ncbi:MAG: TIGR02594 family protein [Sphingomonas sp.]|nr:TIGR02594 family protein [Sphingomonas sp.]
MAALDPKNYAWLDTLPTPLPLMIQKARGLLGVKEVPGAYLDNPEILKWASAIGGDVERTYTHDSIPWCGLFMAYVAKSAGKVPPSDPLWALSWLKFGVEAGQPALGDVMVFVREGGGHVTLYIAEDATAYHVLGGNQSDQVCFARYPKDRFRAARRPPYTVTPPAVKPYRLRDGATGPLAPGDQ